MRHNKNVGLIYIIGGGVLLFLGLSKFIFHVVLVLTGFILLNAGLRMLGKPSLLGLVGQWLSTLRG